MIDRTAAAAAPRARLTTALLRWCPFWPFWLLCSLLLPTSLSFMLGSLRIHPTRVILIIAFIPALLRLFGGKAGPVRLMDWLILIFLIWSFIVISYHHGLSIAIQSGGINMLELGGGYLIARTWILKERDYRGATLVLLALICLLTPLVFLESITGVHLFMKLASSQADDFGIGQRMGLTRAFGPFDHPIHLGVFAASLLVISLVPALPRLGRPRQPGFLKYGVIISTMSSMSSGGLFTLLIQAILLFWERITRRMTSRWIKFLLLFSLLYVSIELTSKRSAVIVVLSYLTFSADTAYNRAMIFDWGMDNLRMSPVMGIGFNDWIRPEWVFSSSMDNFWLVQAVTYGVPGFILLAFSTWLMLVTDWKNLAVRVRRLRTAWTMSMLGLIFAATTVHLWNSLYIFFAFMLGMGGWFHNIRRNHHSG